MDRRTRGYTLIGTGIVGLILSLLAIFRGIEDVQMHGKCGPGQVALANGYCVAEMDRTGWE